MTTNNTNNRSGPYAGDGVTTNLTVSFYFLLDAELLVTRLNADGTTTTLALTTDYTVTGKGVSAGGAIIFNTPATAFPSGCTVTITPNPSLVQNQSYPATGIFPSLATEQGLDRLTIIANYLLEKINRALLLPISSSLTGLAIPSPVASQLLGWNSAATALQNYGVASLSLVPITTFWQAILANSTAAPSLTALGFSSFIQTLIDDANAAAARTTLDAEQKAGSLTGVAPATGDSVIITDLSDSGKSKSALISDVLALAAAPNTYGFKNFIKNGAFNIWQRATSYALTTSIAYGSADRWAAIMGSSAAGIFNQDTSITAGLGFKYNAKVGRNNGSALTNSIAIYQALETLDSIPLAGQSVTVSYYAKKGANFSAASNNLNLVFNTGTGTDQSVSSMNANTWTGQVQTLVSDAITTSWVRYQHTFTVPSSTTQAGIQIYYTPVGTAGADDNFYITGVQMEIGTSASSYNFMPFEVELALCQRYYEKSFPYATAPAQNAGTSGSVLFPQVVAASTQSYYFIASYQVEKRVVVSSATIGAILYNPSAANAQLRNVATSTDCSATTVNANSAKTLSVISTSPGGSTQGNGLIVHWTADVEL